MTRSHRQMTRQSKARLLEDDRSSEAMFTQWKIHAANKVVESGTKLPEDLLSSDDSLDKDFDPHQPSQRQEPKSRQNNATITSDFNLKARQVVGNGVGNTHTLGTTKFAEGRNPRIHDPKFEQTFRRKLYERSTTVSDLV